MLELCNTTKLYTSKSGYETKITVFFFNTFMVSNINYFKTKN